MKSRRSQTRSLLILIGIVTSVVISGCDIENPLDLPDVREDNEVFITSNGFEPRTLTISAGTRVMWTNKDTEIQCVESGAPMNPTQIFVSPQIRPGQTWECEDLNGDAYTFPTKGDFSYYCSLTLATGTIVVN